jgi:hypothetical protein
MKWKDPTRGAGEKQTLLELRSSSETSSAQTVAPPSVHWTGEVVTWEKTDGIARVPRADLERALRRLAAASLLARHWQEPRAFCSMALCGALARADWSDDQIVHFVTAVSACANRNGTELERSGEPEKRRRHLSEARARLEKEEPCAGLAKLAEHGVPDKVIGKVREWLGLPINGATEADRNAILGAAGLPPGEASPSITPPEDTSLLHVRADVIAARPREPIRIYSTGDATLDTYLGRGFCTRRLLAHMGPPGAGKTAWAIAMALGLEVVLPVLYASTELESEELESRAAANIIGCAWSDIEAGVVPREKVTAALAGKRLYLIGCEKLPIDGAAALKAISRSIEALATEHGTPPVCFIDYIQDLARGDEKGLRARVGNTAVALRVMSQRCDCSMIGLSSVSREFYGKNKARWRQSNDPTIYLAAAKESGDVDFAAGFVCFLDVEEKGSPRLGRLAVAKARRGRTGFAGVEFYAASGRFKPSERALVALAAGAPAKDRADQQTRDNASRLVAKVKEWAAKGDFKTKSQVRDSGAVPKTKQTLEWALESGDLEIQTLERTEGLKSKRRDLVVPRGYAPPGERAKPEEPIDLGETMRKIVGGAA